MGVLKRLLFSRDYFFHKKTLQVQVSSIQEYFIVVSDVRFYAVLFGKADFNVMTNKNNVITLKVMTKPKKIVLNTTSLYVRIIYYYLC